MCSLGAVEPRSWIAKHWCCGLVAQAVCCPIRQNLINQENATPQGLHYQTEH